MRKLVPLLAALALLGPPAGTALAASPTAHAVQGPIACTSLSQGDYGTPVRVLQGDLAQLGLFRGRVTGYFGRVTAGALRRFQSHHGLSATAVLDGSTLAAIKRAMHITGPDPNCGASTSGGATAGSAPGSGAASAGGSGGATGPSVPMVHPISGIISPTPSVAIDYEYTWFSPGFALGGSGACSRQSTFGAWDATHGYAGIVLDLGDPLGLQARAGGLAAGETQLRNAEQCFTKGYTGAAGGAQPLIYVGFSNCVPTAGASGACGALGTSASKYQTAGRTAAAYVASGTANVKGAWFDAESDWSTMAAVHSMVAGYLAVNPSASGHPEWCDSTYRNYASGRPNNSWTVASMLSGYISPLLNAGYDCLGSQRVLIPQAYAASWLTNGTANFSPASSLAKYVGGITVCGAGESTGRCPDLGIPGSTSKATKWYDYAHDGYAAAASSVVAVVGGGALKISI